MEYNERKMLESWDVMLSKVKSVDFIQWFIMASVLAMGLFHEFLSCIAGIVLCVYICAYANKNKKLTFCLNLSSVSILLICGFYCLSCFWAIDKGFAVMGIFKFLPVLLFLFALMQQKNDGIEHLEILPFIAGIMTVISAILMQIPALKGLFSVSGRLSGFFQYSNTFALLLLVSMIVIVTKEKLAVLDLVLLPILLFGIVYSGSRTVFLLMIATVFLLVIFGKNKKLKLSFLVIVAVGILAAVVYALATDKFNSIGRFLTISLTESTFVGRLLYFYDAIPVILKHPFGMGYLGYYYYQQGIQTGLYTVRFIHNDFLQLMLDIGWVPVIVFCCAILKSFFKKGASLRKRLLLLVMCAHTCFDFNFQYVAMLMIFVMVLDYKDGKNYVFAPSKALQAVTATVLSVAFAYIGTAHALCQFRQHELSDKLYPWNVQNHIEMITELQDYEDINAMADRIISENEYVAIAYDAKSRYYYKQGDFANMIKYKDLAINAAPFNHEAYEDYCRMLLNGIYLYLQIDDEYSANVCRGKYYEVKEKLESNKERLSELGKMINDQPVTELSEEILEYAEELGV